MTPLHFPRSPLPLPPPSISPPCSTTPLFSFKPLFSSSSRKKPVSLKLPARDRVIDFGKHRGRMLGTLPSKYLTWVSKNLRARDFEEWAKLADEVLLDPVYKDRMEWESAEKILSGEGLKASRSESPVSGLLEISERFGWDNEDKVGWSKVDFELLGTSRGGRIPRGKLGGEEKSEAFAKERGVGFLSRDSRVSNRKQMGPGFVSRDSRVSKISSMGFSFKRDSEINGDSRNSGFLEEGEERSDGIAITQKNGRKNNGYSKNPFPGREALLDKIRRREDR